MGSLHCFDRYTVVLDVEESHVGAGFAQLPSDGYALYEDVAKNTGHIDDGELRGHGIP